MKKNYLLLIILSFAFGATAQVINIPDPEFKARLLAADVSNNTAQDVDNNNIKIDINSNGEIEESEALLVYRLFYTTPPPLRMNSGTQIQTAQHLTTTNMMADLTGISHFTKLRKLDVSNNLLTTLDLTGLNYLDFLDCSNNSLTSVDVGGLVNLTYFKCSNNNLPALYLGSLYNLAHLYCDTNALTLLDVTNLTHLVRLGCFNNGLATVQFGNNGALEDVYCYNNQLTEIDLSGTSAKLLYCNDNPGLVSINLKNNVDSPFDFEMPPIPFPINSFDFTNLPALASICCDANETAVMTQVLSGQLGVTLSTSCVAQIVDIPDANLKNRLVNTPCASFEEGVPSSSYNSSVDTNGDGEIQLSEAIAVKGLKIDTSIMTTAGDIHSVEGLQYFTNLQRLNCNGNQIESLDVTMMADLLELNCHHNHLTTLNFSGLSLLELVRCYHNSIAVMPLDGLPVLNFLQASQNSLGQLDVTTLPSLIALLCDSNQLDALVIHDMPLLQEVEAYNNLLSSIDLNGLSGLRILGIENNLFTDFDLSPVPGLEMLNISSNAITEIDLDGYINLGQLKIGNTLVSQIDCSQSGISHLSCSFNPNLTSINLKNGVISHADQDLLDYPFVFSELPLLSSICIDDDQNERISVALTDYNLSGNVTVYTGEDCLTEVVMATSGFQSANALRIYPNPVADVLHVDFTAENVKSIVIANSLGQQIRTITDISPNNSIVVSGLAKGLYFVTLTTDSGKTTQKFLKL